MKNIAAILLTSVLFVACKKEEVTNPTPEEQELITTMRLEVTNTSGFNKTFTYKVDNGFGSSAAGDVHIDDVVLGSNTEYNVVIKVLNESASPTEDITEEVLSENEEHLFVYESKPSTGAGSITFSNGSKDDAGLPFNQQITFKTGDAGAGQLIVALKHQPTDKNATQESATGGETDARAIFPVTVQ